jgi:hypothetical protein
MKELDCQAKSYNQLHVVSEEALANVQVHSIRGGRGFLIFEDEMGAEMRTLQVHKFFSIK